MRGTRVRGTRMRKKKKKETLLGSKEGGGEVLTHAQRRATTTTATSNERRARRHRGQQDRSHHEVGRYQRAFGVRNEPLPDLMRSPLTELNAADRSGTCSSFHDLGPS